MVGAIRIDADLREPGIRLLAADEPRRRRRAMICQCISWDPVHGVAEPAITRVLLSIGEREWAPDGQSSLGPQPGGSHDDPECGGDTSVHGLFTSKVLRSTGKTVSDGNE